MDQPDRQRHRRGGWTRKYHRQGVRGRRACGRGGRRRRTWDTACGAGPPLRAFLHHQGYRVRDRARAGYRATHRHRSRRRGLCPVRAWGDMLHGKVTFRYYTERRLISMGKTHVYEEICTQKREVDARVLEQTVSLAVEIAGGVLSGARYIDAASDSLDLPLGLGSRHVAGASISRQTRAVAVVVSESSMVRMFDDGELVSEIVPELWMIEGYTSRMEGRIFTRRDAEVTVVGRAE